MFMADVIVDRLMMKTFKSRMMLRGGRGFATRKCGIVLVIGSGVASMSRLQFKRRASGTVKQHHQLLPNYLPEGVATIQISRNT
jgi:hypothetical protein